jgi:hypothetical protein
VFLRNGILTNGNIFGELSLNLRVQFFSIACRSHGSLVGSSSSGGSVMGCEGMLFIFLIITLFTHTLRD